MAISTKGFTQLVPDMVASVQGAASTLVDLSVGSVLLSIIEAVAAVVLWLQGLILRLLATTRAATSNGPDLDSFMADFGVTREGAVAATGSVTFARFTSTATASVPVGASIQTADGSQSYTVDLDSSNPAYSAGINAYAMAIGTGSVTVRVTATSAGVSGNAQAGQITVITQPLPGIDTVTNTMAFATGIDAESDTALRARFIAFIASLSKATRAAIAYAITSVQQGISYSLTENLNYAGTASPGYFYAVIDDGSGAPSGALLASVGNAIETARPFTVTYGVFATTTITANTSMTITTAAGYVHADVVALVVAALTNYITSLGIGDTLRYTRIAQIAYDASPGITNVASVLLNGGTADIATTAKQTVIAGTQAVT